MGRKRAARAARQLVRDREKLAVLTPGGSAERPLAVPSAAVVEIRACATPCAQCEGVYRVVEHRAPSSGLRSVDVQCQRCRVKRTLWFRITSDDPN